MESIKNSNCKVFYCFYSVVVLITLILTIIEIFYHKELRSLSNNFTYKWQNSWDIEKFAHFTCNPLFNSLQAIYVATSRVGVVFFSTF